MFIYLLYIAYVGIYVCPKNLFVVNLVKCPRYTSGEPAKWPRAPLHVH